MYLCELCRTPFDRPLTITERAVEDGHIRTDVETLCPVCGHAHYAPAEECPVCKGWKFQHEHLCASCRSDLLRRVIDFADGLTAEEEEQLDDWMDGDTITNRRKWK